MSSAKLAQNGGSQYGPNYLFTTAVEDNFNVPSSLEWFNEHWYVPYIMAIGVYLPVLYFGQLMMSNREPFRLKLPLILWNTSLAIFSILGFLRVFPEMVHVLNKHGFYHSICNNSYLQIKQCSFWIYLFVLSKTPELVDTVFLVLKKQKLIFLHVYHHATVLMFSWFVYSNQLAAARWFCTMNFGVHSVMYTYYALKALPNIVKVPKWISMVITTSQTLQMVMGSYVVGSAFYHKLNGEDCATTTTMSIFGLIIYVSYLFLFSHFFYKAYCSPSQSREKRPLAEKKRA